MYSRSGITNYPGQFGLLLAVFGFGIVLSALILLPLSAWLLHIPMEQLPEALKNPANANASKLIQGVGSVITLGVPAAIFAMVIKKTPFTYLGFSRYLTGKQVFLVIAIVCSALLVGGALSYLNEIIPLPAGWAAKFKKLEEDYAQQIITVAGMKNVGEFLLSLFILAFLPALTEELFFRGCLQQVLVGWTKNAFVGILITSVVFSAAHSSYYGFLPRVFLGLALGYIFYDSRNLWLSIWAHFFNNALSLTQLYALSRAGKLTTESMNDSFPPYVGLIGLVAVVSLFYSFRKESNRILAIRETAEQQHNDVNVNP